MGAPKKSFATAVFTSALFVLIQPFAANTQDARRPLQLRSGAGIIAKIRPALLTKTPWSAKGQIDACDK